MDSPDIPVWIWGDIVQLIAIEEPLEAVKCSLVSKLFFGICRNGALWECVCRRQYMRHDNGNVSATLPIDKYQSWYQFYREKVFLRSFLPLEGKRSIYNAGYHCTITAVKFSPKKFTVYLDERGDNTLGGIQNPLHSTFSTGGNSLPMISSKFLIADRNAQYLGKLVYSPCYLKNESYEFRYGSGGYSLVELFFLDENFIRQYRLSHIIKQANATPGRKGNPLFARKLYSGRKNFTNPS